MNIFGNQNHVETTDSDLVGLAQQGDRQALEQLILRHQAWIYNIALRMVGHPPDAEDVTQEILIKMMTRLSTFQGKSSFRTWLYRIVANHVINMRKRGMEYVFSSFERHDQVRRNAADMDIPDQQSIPVDVSLLVEETKMGCMSGMLLCLDRTQRLVFTLGAVLGVESEPGAEILEISPANFRQILSRARKQLGNYMNEKCGLMNTANPCNCARKTKAAIKAGYVDPDNLLFYEEHVRKVRSLIAEQAQTVEDALEMRAQHLFQDHPFRESPNYVQILAEILDQYPFQELVNFN